MSNRDKGPKRPNGVSERFFPGLCDANDDPRATLAFDDGIQWVRDTDDAGLDLVIVDSTDPIGPAVGLFRMVRVLLPQPLLDGREVHLLVKTTGHLAVDLLGGVHVGLPHHRPGKGGILLGGKRHVHFLLDGRGAKGLTAQLVVHDLLSNLKGIVPEGVLDVLGLLLGRHWAFGLDGAGIGQLILQPIHFLLNRCAEGAQVRNAQILNLLGGPVTSRTQAVAPLGAELIQRWGRGFAHQRCTGTDIEKCDCFA